MKNNTLKLILFILMALSVKSSYAQKTGAFNETITFNNEQRTLSFFVPANYDSTISYRLVVGLHGAGDNSNNYRNGMSNAYISNMPNTILVCPDGGNDQARSFNLPAGDEEIIQEAINLANANYNISADNIILQGFSLGGRSALHYGLLYPEKFKGLLLNTPAIQGIKDALGQTFFGPFNYANASRIPVYITHGDLDVNYTGPIDTAYEKLIINNGIVRLYRFTGMGHTIPAFNRISNFIDFFNDHSSHDYDVEAVKILNPARTCDAQIQASVLVRNLGKNNITSIDIEYQVNAAAQTFKWNGNLMPFQHAIIALPQTNANAGNNSINVTVKTLNANIQDTVTVNNQKTATYNYVNSSVKLPLTEGFEGANFPPDGWVLQRSGDYILPWTKDTDIKKDGAASIISFNTIFIFDNAGRREEILSPVLDLSSGSSPVLNFDVAYNYFKYTPPYFTDTTEFADTLQVLISTDCGKTFSSLYKKGGKDLMTFDAPMLNVLNINAIDFSPEPKNWRRERISLSNYSANTEAVIKFSYISALGGMIALDNITFASVTGMEEEKSLSGIKLFPNPATDMVNLKCENENILKVNVLDISGRNLMTVTNNTGNKSEIQVNTSSLSNGFYIFEVVSAKEINTGKILIKR